MQKTRIPAQKRSIQKKEKILKAAYELMVERGLKDIGIRDIVQRASVSIGTFYAYFKNKNDVITELLSLFSMEVYGNFAENMIRDIPPDADIEEIIHTMVVELYGLYKKFASLHRELVILSLTDPSLNRIYESIKHLTGDRVLTRLFNHYRDRMEFNDSEAAIVVTHRAIDNIIIYLLFYEPTVPPERILREASRMVMRYLVKE